jgi:predicted ATPase
VQNIEKTNLLRLELRIGDIGDWRRPSNIGYGLTYAFPIIVAGLLAKRGQILIIDSPEAHLHPKGQSQMGHFLATIAAAGVQVIVETHSDHLLNGIRRAIGERKILAADEATVHFFDTKDSSPVKLKFTETGSINAWPSGFFDQYQLDISALTKVRRPRMR